MQEHLTALAWLQPGERLLSLSSAGAGNMNRTLRAKTSQRTFILKQSVPFVAKYPQIPAPVERLEVERQFYNLIAEQDALALRTPHVLGYDAANHLLALEDLGSAGDMQDAYAAKPEAALQRGQITALVYWLWKLHALDVEGVALENPAMRELNHAHIFEIPLADDNGVELPPALQDSAATLRGDAALTDAAAALGEVYLGRAPYLSRPALLHGDYYPGSWLRQPRAGVAVIDPEFAFIGPAEFDLSVMIAHLTFCHFEQADLMNVFRSYIPPPGFDFQLASRFAGMEIIRRLLGVAQLPLAASDEQKLAWLSTARQMVTA